MSLCVAKSRNKAIEITKIKTPKNEKLVQGDNIYNMDDCIKVEKMDNFYVALNIYQCK